MCGIAALLATPLDGFGNYGADVLCTRFGIGYAFVETF